MLFIRYFILRFAQELPEEIRGKVFQSGKCAIVPATDNVSGCVCWREINCDDIEGFRNKKIFAEFVSDMDKEALLLRDEYAARVGPYGIPRAISPFGEWIATTEEECQTLVGEDYIEYPNELTVRLEVGVTKRNGIRPIQPFREGSMLMTRAEGQRERILSVVEYIKIFENAFGLRNEGKLIVKLERFLNAGPLEYEKSEIKNWFKIRGQDAHAAEIIARFDEAKYDLTLDRLRQAAVDICYNKREWGDARALRENRVHLDVWVDKKGGCSFTRGAMIEHSVHRECLGGFLMDLALDRESDEKVKNQILRFVNYSLVRDVGNVKQLVITDNIGKEIRLIAWPKVGELEAAICEWSYGGR